MVVKKADFSHLSRDELIHAIKLMEAVERDRRYNKLTYMYPDKGPLARNKYPKQMEFYKAGALYRERAAIGANRSGKSLMTKYEVALHLTGLYPEWWEGKRFYEPPKIWCACETHDLVRDVAQVYLLGETNDLGSGLIPRDRIVETRAKAGIPNAVSEAVIRWGDKSNQYATIGFKSYIQGREAFQGVALHMVDFDEEPPQDIYSEALTRTMTTEGIVTAAFTPLKGMSEVTQSFLPEGRFTDSPNVPGTSKYVVQLTWDIAPHLKEADKTSMLKSYQPWEIEARTKGIPSVGSGKIYPTLEGDFVVKPFDIPPSWPRMYGMDVGWKCTAAVFMAINPHTGDFYIYDEYSSGEKHAAIHAAAISSRAGTWMYGAIDPASQQGNPRDGIKFLHEYQGYGLNLRVAVNAVEAGLAKVIRLFTLGKLKVFDTCTGLLQEYRMYHRNERGEVVKKDDHLLDCMRYAIMTSYLANTKPDKDDDKIARARKYLKEMNRDDVTGY